MQPAEHFLTVPEHTDQYIYQHMRRHSLIHMETECVDAQSFEDDLLLLQQDISSFEYLGRGGGFRRGWNSFSADTCRLYLDHIL